MDNEGLIDHNLLVKDDNMYPLCLLIRVYDIKHLAYVWCTGWT